MMTQINKTVARKLYNEGKTFWMTACNMRPECGILINSAHREYDEDFNKLVNTFVYYNCNNETGRYPRYYIDGE